MSVVLSQSKASWTGRKRTKDNIKREDKSKKKQKVGQLAAVPLLVAPQQPP
jgi:hypothetical protein